MCAFSLIAPFCTDRKPLPHGFTLIEIIVVCVLIGIVSSLAISNLVVSNDNLARAEALKFGKHIDYLKEESLLSGKPMAIGVDGSENSAKGYRFYAYVNEWVEVKDSLLKASLFPEGIKVTWSVSSDEDDRIVVDPIGMISNFSVSFIGKNQRFDAALSEELDVVVMEKTIDGS